MSYIVPVQHNIQRIAGVCTLTLISLKPDFLFLFWNYRQPRRTPRYVTLRGTRVLRGSGFSFKGWARIAQNEIGDTTTHTFDLSTIDPDRTFWYVLSDGTNPDYPNALTVPVQVTSCPAPSITKEVEVFRDTTFPNNVNLEVQIPWEVEVSDNYNGWPCAAAVRRLCVDDLSLWVDDFALYVRNGGTASNIVFRIRTMPNNVIVWQETVAFGGNEAKYISRVVDYLPAAGSLSVMFTIQEPVLGGGFGWTLSLGGVDSSVYHHNQL